MSSLDQTQALRHRMQVAQVDPALPLGIHPPKLDGDVGWDLEAMEDVQIPPMEARDVPINAQIALPDGHWAEIRSRSSIARRNLQVDAGTIDNGYRGPLFVLVRNMQLPDIHPRLDHEHGYDDLSNWATIQRGDRIGQLVIYRMSPVWMLTVPTGYFQEELMDTQRGTAGFGSTGR
jgi:dUTP pyrophosphatase